MAHEKKLSQKLFYWLPTFLWMAVIFFLSAQTGDDLHSAFPFLDNFDIGHPVEYFILALVFYYSLTKTTEAKYLSAWTLIFVFFYGLSDEFHQSFVPGRMPDVNDLVRDIFGGALALGLIRFKKRLKQTS